MKLLVKFNIILLVVFTTGGLAISLLARSFLIGNARREVQEQAKLMMASAKAVRDYTDTDLSPLLQQNPGHRVHFLPETIPFYGANTTFNILRKDYPDYTYKESALNPTNLEDRAVDWESDIIRRLRDHPEESEIDGERETPIGSSLYIAKPIRVADNCLECHGTPSVAPAAMRAVYGTANGFGWKLGEVIGAQIVSVPMSVPLKIAEDAFHRLIFFLVAMMLLAVAAIDAGVVWFVIRPLRIVSETADRISRGDRDVPPIKIQGGGEIATVAASFERMHVSLNKAIAMLKEE